MKEILTFVLRIMNFDCEVKTFNFSFFIFHFSFQRVAPVLSFQTIFIQKIFRLTEDLHIQIGVVLCIRN